MKTIIPLSAALLLSTGSAAFAGGLAEPVMAPAPAPVPVAAAPIVTSSDWSGFYVGGQAGAGNVELDATTTTDLDLNNYGVQAGYLYDLGSFVVGGEASYNKLDIDTLGDDNSVTRVGAIAGFDAGRFMPYLAGGYASLDTDALGQDNGYYYGVGATYAVTDSINVGVEYLKHEFDDFNDTGTDVTADTTSLKVSYKF